MSSVTQRIREIKQPRGGYLKPSDMEKIELDDGNELEEENINASLIGLAVDYMTRFVMGAPAKSAFNISLMGSTLVGELDKANKLVEKIDGLNKESVINACKLVGYDVCFRAGLVYFKNVDEINADDNTVDNIIVMVNRSMAFFKKYGPIIKDGFTFEGAYNDIVTSGDGDFLTSDTLWDFKVSSKPPTSENTLQLLMYYIMGKKSIHDEFKNIKKIGIFNPRLNTVYLKVISDIPLEVINEVHDNVIGYNVVNNKLNIDGVHEMDSRLEMTEIMKVLKCSRYKVMKYYAEDDLPLIKEKNKYYIDEDELYLWIEEKKKQERVQLIFSIIMAVIMIVGLIFIFFVLK